MKKIGYKLNKMNFAFCFKQILFELNKDGIIMRQNKKEQKRIQILNIIMSQIESSIRKSTGKQSPKPLSPVINHNNSSSTNINNPSIKQRSYIKNSSAPMSKLHQYFSSSQYLSCQQQLSIFIQNFPIIDIESSHKSINEILPLLIRQNQLLSKKCQSQVLLIKESFSKHQALNKQSKKVKEEMELVQNQCKQLLKQNESQVIEGIKKVDEMTKKMKVYHDFINQQNIVFKHIVNNEWKKGEQMAISRNLRIIYDQFIMDSNKPSRQSNGLSQTAQIVPLQQLQKHCKQWRKRLKYFSRVKSSVEEFCNRLIKISSIVPGEMLSRELTHQCSEFVEIVSELVSLGEGSNKRKREDWVKRRDSKEGNKLMNVNSEQSLLSKSQLQAALNEQQSANNNCNVLFSDKQSTLLLRPSHPSSFESLLSTFLAQSTKKYQQTISSLQTQLQDITSQLQTSKQYYETYLINTKLQYQTRVRNSQEQLTIKDEMCKHFQDELERCFGVKEDLENRVGLLEKENQEMKNRQSPLKEQISQLTQQLKQQQQSITKAINKNKSLEYSLTQNLTKKQNQFTSSLQKLQFKLKAKQQQHQTQLNKKHSLIKTKQQEITQLNQEIRSLKQNIQDNNIQLNRVTKRLHLIEQDHVRKLESQVSTIEQEISSTKKANKQLAKTIQQLNQELSINATYIKELQSKSQKKDQAIEKLNKKLSASQLQSKSLKLLKQANQKLQSQLRDTNSQLKKSLEDNSSLKRLVKEMKKQLEQVYHTINDLKSIQKDREKLLLESQKSERWKEQIMKDYDQMKYEILKVQAENKNFALEVRHYKNALKRIQMIN